MLNADGRHRHFVHCLRHMDCTEFAARVAYMNPDVRAFPWRHAALDVVLGLAREVVADLLVEVLHHALSVAEESCPSAHGIPLCWYFNVTVGSILVLRPTCQPTASQTAPEAAQVTQPLLAVSNGPAQSPMPCAQWSEHRQECLCHLA